MAIGFWGKIVLAVGVGGFAAPALSAPAAMPTGGRTSQPIGHYEFCKANPAECRPNGGRPAPVSLNPATWAAMTRINAQVNRVYKPMTDYEIWGKEEVWSYPATYADCEDYVLEKRRRLAAKGFPIGNLLITVLRQSNGDGHAVLTVRTTGGDYILDNLDGRVRRWSETDYTFLKRQSESDAGVWLTINDGRDPAVASVR